MQFGYPSFSNLQTTNSRWLSPFFVSPHFHRGLLATAGNVPGLLLVYLIGTALTCLLPFDMHPPRSPATDTQ